VAFAEFFSIGRHYQRQVDISRNLGSQGTVEKNLPRSGGEQVGPPDHLVHSGIGIVHDNRQLISEKAIGPAQNEIPHGTGEVLFNPSENPIGEAEHLFRNSQTQSPGSPIPGNPQATGPRIDRTLLAGMGSTGQDLPP
jgi:hypothetical protein